jgi:iron complex transport system ATP-binding protein
MSRPILELQGLCVTRGDNAILDRVSWRVEPGQHWAILGPNGSGKTSLLNLLPGYVTPGDGRMTVLGRQYGEEDWLDVRHAMGLVSSSLLARIGDGENVLETVISGKYGWLNFWGRLFSDDGRRARNVLRMVECAGLARRKWGTLSQGEKQRVLIGRALMARPKILLLDEPCVGLDLAAREKFLRFLRHLGTRPNGPTLLMSTHHPEEITPVFKHVLLLKAGRVFAAGALNDVLTSENLSKLFGKPLRLDRADDGFRVVPQKR